MATKWQPLSALTNAEWLAQIKLHRYGAAMKEEGYDELDFLRAVGESDIEEMTTSIGMKKPHAIVLRPHGRNLSMAIWYHMVLQVPHQHLPSRPQRQWRRPTHMQ